MKCTKVKGTHTGWTQPFSLTEGRPSITGGKWKEDETAILDNATGKPQKLNQILMGQQ